MLVFFLLHYSLFIPLYISFETSFSLISAYPRGCYGLKFVPQKQLLKS